MSNRRLTVALPDAVWDRLKAEAEAQGLTIGTHARNLFIKRDDKRKDKADDA